MLLLTNFQLATEQDILSTVLGEHVHLISMTDTDTSTIWSYSKNGILYQLTVSHDIPDIEIHMLIDTLIFDVDITVVLAMRIAKMFIYHGLTVYLN